MNQDFKEEWVAALRSGEYEQGYNVLKTNDSKFCCLGVACDLLVKKGLVEESKIDESSNNYYRKVGSDTRQYEVFTDDIAELIGLSDGNPLIADENQELVDIASYNDSGHTFKEIASIIENQL